MTTDKATVKVGDAGASGKAGKGNRRTLGIVGCVLLVLVLCCVGSLALFWFTGDSILDILQNYIQ
ncbi:MAG: hypothetical protein WEC37_04145 [Anaerolineales bacterium]